MRSQVYDACSSYVWSINTSTNCLATEDINIPPVPVELWGQLGNSETRPAQPECGVRWSLVSALMIKDVVNAKTAYLTGPIVFEFSRWVGRGGVTIQPYLKIAGYFNYDRPFRGLVV